MENTNFFMGISIPIFYSRKRTKEFIDGTTNKPSSNMMTSFTKLTTTREKKRRNMLLVAQPIPT